MRIVPQAAPFSHSFFPPPLLMLPAPRIAGLLAARVSEPEAPVNNDFHYTHPELASLPDEQRERLFNGVKILLDVALDVALHGLGDEALRAAEVVFHRAAGGQTPEHFAGPAAYNAEVDADIMIALVELSHITVPTREEAMRELDERLRAYREQEGGDTWANA